MSRATLWLFSSCLFLACQPQAPSPAGNPLDGAWTLVAIQNSNDSGTTNSTPQESLFLFAGNHYSMAYVEGAQRAPYYATRFNPTDEENLARVKSMTVNAGTMEIEGNRITVHPLVARVPEFVGGRADHEYTLSGDTLTLHWLRTTSADGVVNGAGGTILTLIRLR